MQRFVFAFGLVLISFFTLGQDISLSEEAEISIITCGPDPNELYSAFGHSAVRVIDPVNRIDYAFNYGVFDFDQPNFYLNFARGRNYYMLAVYQYQDFEWAYKRDGRFIHLNFARGRNYYMLAVTSTRILNGPINAMAVLFTNRFCN
mgnify:CR=1 FL=1